MSPSKDALGRWFLLGAFFALGGLGCASMGRFSDWTTPRSQRSSAATDTDQTEPEQFRASVSSRPRSDRDAQSEQNDRPIARDRSSTRDVREVADTDSPSEDTTEFSPANQRLIDEELRDATDYERTRWLSYLRTVSPESVPSLLARRRAAIESEASADADTALAVGTAARLTANEELAEWLQADDEEPDPDNRDNREPEQPPGQRRTLRTSAIRPAVGSHFSGDAPETVAPAGNRQLTEDDWHGDTGTTESTESPSDANLIPDTESTSDTASTSDIESDTGSMPAPESPARGRRLRPSRWLDVSPAEEDDTATSHGDPAAEAEELRPEDRDENSHPLDEDDVTVDNPAADGPSRTASRDSLAETTVPERSSKKKESKGSKFLNDLSEFDARKLLGSWGDSTRDQREEPAPEKVRTRRQEDRVVPTAQANEALGPTKARPDASYSEDELRRLISLLEAEVRPLHADAPSSERQQHIRKQVHLRLLHLMENEPELAQQPIEGLAPHEQEFWSGMFWGLSNYFDEDANPDPGERAAQTVNQLRTAIRRLQATADLELANACFCRGIQGFGAYDRVDKPEFAAGASILVYNEVKNFQSEPTVDGFFRTVLQSTIEISRVGADGQVLERTALPTTDLCRNERTDFYTSYYVDLPSHLGPGPYLLKLTVEDGLQTGKLATQTLAFTIR